MSSLLPKSTASADPQTGNQTTIKFTVLVLLCLQNGGQALLARYSKGTLKETYSGTEVVMVAEVLKIIVSGYLTVVDTTESDAQGKGWGRLLWLLANSRKTLVLVFLYSMANILTFVALERIDASVYTVVLQLKILSTALFAVLILGRNVSNTKWRALGLLVIGSILVASPSFNQCECLGATVVDGGRRLLRLLAATASNQAAVGADEDPENSLSGGFGTQLVGICAVMMMVVISGYAAIYFESILKTGSEKLTIWERNFQLASYSVILLFAINFGEFVSKKPGQTIFFEGWTFNTVIIALLMASGGLLVAATLKYADAILKTLATAASIAGTAVLGHLLLGATLDVFVVLGCVVTILGIVNYTFDTTPAPPAQSK